MTTAWTAGAVRRVAGWSLAAGLLCRRLPMTLGLVATTTVIATVGDVEAFVIAMIVAIGPFGAGEWLAGTARVLVASVVTIVPPSALVFSAAAISGAPTTTWSTTSGIDVSLVTVGALLAVSRVTAKPHRWTRACGIFVVSVVVLYSMTSVGAVAVGAVLIGMMIADRHASAAHHLHDVRSRAAAAVAVIALGPLADAISGGAGGLLSPVVHFLVNGFALPWTPLHTIAGPWREALLTSMRFLPTAALVSCAVGLWNGSRFALRVAVGVSVLLGLECGALFAVLSTIGSVPASMRLEDVLVFGGSLTASTVIPCLIAVVLVFQRRAFPVRIERRVLRRSLWTVVGTVTLSAVLLALIAVIGPERGAEDVRGVASSVVIVACVSVVVGVGVVASIPSRSPVVRDELRLRALLTHGGGGIFAHMATWRGNSHWFDPRGDAVVAYRVTAGVAITVGQPVCDGHRAGEVARDFTDFCRSNGWIPAFYGVDSVWAERFRALGWSVTAVGDDATIDVTSWTLSGRKKQDLRTSVNRLEREGTQTTWTTWTDLSEAVRAQVVALSERWVAERRLPEMGFTLGGVDELRDPNVRLAIALSQNGRLLAVTSWLPIWADERVVGWTLDVMRRAGHAPNGVMEGLIASVLERSRLDGVQWVSLSAVPLLRSDGQSTPMAERFADVTEACYGFRSLSRFKRKFGPVYRPLHLATPSATLSPLVAFALLRTYLPGLSIRHLIAAFRGRA